MEKSTSIKAIAKALLLFNQKVGALKKDSVNPFFKSKYCSLSNILEHIALPLGESGLSFAQFPDDSHLTTILMHEESGEYLQASYLMPVSKPNDPQAVGSSITYARRYALGAILGLNVEEDDDGNKAATPATAQSTPAATSGAQAEDNRPWLSEKAFTQALERIRAGELEVFEKTANAFKMKKDYRTQLQNALAVKN